MQWGKSNAIRDITIIVKLGTKNEINAGKIIQKYFKLNFFYLIKRCITQLLIKRLKTRQILL